MTESTSNRKDRKYPLPPWAAKYESTTCSVYPQKRKGGLFFGLFEKQQGGPYIYVGSITEADGFKPVKSRKRNKEQGPPVDFDPLALFPSSDTDVYEFGFSRAMITLGEPICRRHDPENAMDTLTALILSISPNSYLKRSPKTACTCARGIVERKLNKELPVSINALYRMLSSISLIVRHDESVTSRMSDEQKEFCQKYNLKMGGE